MRANNSIREMAKKNHVHLWEIAVDLGVSEPTITRWLRTELSEDRKKMVVDAIKRISERKEMEVEHGTQNQ